MKRFSVRDGMGVDRLRTLLRIETGIVSGESSGSLVRRAKKLGIAEVHLGVRDKLALVETLAARLGWDPIQIAYIGDDVNDLAAMKRVGLSACPADAEPEVASVAEFVCRAPGGRGAFRELAELLIRASKGGEPAA